MRYTTLFKKLAKAYGIRYVCLFNVKRKASRRYKFYSVFKTDNVRWFLLRLQHDFPEATVTIADAKYAGTNIVIRVPSHP